MRTLLNIVQLLLAGFGLAVGYVIAGVLVCITIIGIPLGVASFKMAGAALVPVGKDIVKLEALREPPRGAITVGS